MASTDDVICAVIAAFDKNIRRKHRDQCFRGVFVEDGHEVHASECGHYPRAGILVIEWPVCAFEPPGGCIRIDRDDELIAQCFCLFKVIDMSPVEDIETTIGEHNRQPVTSPFLRLMREGILCHDLVFATHVCCRLGINGKASSAMRPKSTLQKICTEKYKMLANEKASSLEIP